MLARLRRVGCSMFIFKTSPYRINAPTEQLSNNLALMGINPAATFRLSLFLFPPFRILHSQIPQSSALSFPFILWPSHLLIFPTSHLLSLSHPFSSSQLLTFYLFPNFPTSHLLSLSHLPSSSQLLTFYLYPTFSSSQLLTFYLYPTFPPSHLPNFSPSIFIPPSHLLIFPTSHLLSLSPPSHLPNFSPSIFIPPSHLPNFSPSIFIPHFSSSQLLTFYLYPTFSSSQLLTFYLYPTFPLHTPPRLLNFIIKLFNTTPVLNILPALASISFFQIIPSR